MGETASGGVLVGGGDGARPPSGRPQLPRECRYRGSATTWSGSSPASCA